MTVYVDDMRAPYRRMIMCHMIADDEAELHAMADRIGVARKWYQGDHYDVCLEKRALAVKAGAVGITWRQCGCMVLHRRRTGKLGTPGEAQAAVESRLGAVFLTPRHVVEDVIRNTDAAGVPPAAPDPDCSSMPEGDLP
jgi:hypothetical protein